MVKHVKSLIFWTLLYKFRKRLSIVAVLLAIVLLSQWIYSDVVEYLKLIEKVDYLSYILPAKWFLIIFNIGLSAYLILTMFKSEKKADRRVDETEEIYENVKLSDREKSFLTKKVRSKAEILMDK